MKNLIYSLLKHFSFLNYATKHFIYDHLDHQISSRGLQLVINLPVQYSKEYNDHMLVEPVELHLFRYFNI